MFKGGLVGWKSSLLKGAKELAVQVAKSTQKDTSDLFKNTREIAKQTGKMLGYLLATNTIL